MQIEINIPATRVLVQAEKTKYLTEQKKAMQMYFKKLAEYATYVKKQSQKKSTDVIKYPPSLPLDMSESFDDSVKILDAHIGRTLVMSDDEYIEMMSVLESAKKHSKASFVSLNSLTY